MGIHVYRPRKNGRRGPLIGRWDRGKFHRAPSFDPEIDEEPTEPIFPTTRKKRPRVELPPPVPMEELIEEEEDDSEEE
jgi:hypothetical protein